MSFLSGTKIQFNCNLSINTENFASLHKKLIENLCKKSVKIGFLNTKFLIDLLPYKRQSRHSISEMLIYKFYMMNKIANGTKSKVIRKIFLRFFLKKKKRKKNYL